MIYLFESEMYVASAINARLRLSERWICRMSGVSWYGWFMGSGAIMQLCGALMLVGTVVESGELRSSCASSWCEKRSFAAIFR
jgi:hypothetical protein